MPLTFRNMDELKTYLETLEARVAALEGKPQATTEKKENEVVSYLKQEKLKKQNKLIVAILVSLTFFTCVMGTLIYSVVKAMQGAW